MFKGYVDPVEGREASKNLPKLMVEGLLYWGAQVLASWLSYSRLPPTLLV